jgi:hypothetical protein
MKYYFEDFIGVFDDVMTTEECGILINHFEGHSSVTRQQHDRVSKIKKEDDTVFIDAISYRSVPFKGMITERLLSCYDLYAKEYAILPTLNEHAIDWCIKIQRTQVGGGYHVWHCEQDGLELSHRFLAWSIYLNDVEEGGETEWLYQHKRVKPKTGTVCIWPSGFTHTHRGNPPLSNEKYITTGWISFIK